MAKARSSEIQIDEDLVFQRREWRVERIGWVVMGLLVLLALAGLFGDGLLSWTDVQNSDGTLRVDYQRFGRFAAAQELLVEFSPLARQDGQAQLAFNQAFLDMYRIEQISPEPQEVVLSDDQIIYSFGWLQGDQPLRVHFSLQPQHVGQVVLRLGPPGGSLLALRLLIFP